MTNQQPFRFQFFLPDARLLTEREVERLAADRAHADASGKNGLWIEIPCPDRSCLDANGKLTIPSGQAQGKGTWLNVFCPENICEIVQSTDLP